MTAARPVSAVFWSLLGLFALVYSWVHHLAGFSFPIPWPDESSFLWPAIAVQEHGTLFAPELNPERHVLWMPPGYAIAMGAIFELTGFSLAWARALSAIFIVGAAACLAGIARSLRFPLVATSVLCLVFLDRYFVLAGNFARMEAMLVLGFAAAALLLARERDAKALAILALCPLIHPNGIYPAAAMGLCFFWRRVRARAADRLTRTDVALLAAVAAAWLGYAVYVGGHWTDFLNDMQFQLSWKQQPGPLDAAFWSRWSAPAHLAMSGCIAAVLAAGIALRAPSTRLLILAVPLHLMPVTQNEWYYEVFRGLAFLLVGFVGIDAIGRAIDRFAPGHRIARRIAAVGCLTVFCAAGFASGWIENPVGYPRSMELAGFRIVPEEPYIDVEEARAVRDFLASLGSDDAPATVVFAPWADALLYHDLRSRRLRFIHPTFYTANPDFAVIHLTRLVPNVGLLFNRDRIARRVRDFPRIVVRNATEQWVYDDHPEPITHGEVRAPRAARKQRADEP